MTLQHSLYRGYRITTRTYRRSRLASLSRPGFDASFRVEGPAHAGDGVWLGFQGEIHESSEAAESRAAAAARASIDAVLRR